MKQKHQMKLEKSKAKYNKTIEKSKKYDKKLEKRLSKRDRKLTKRQAKKTKRTEKFMKRLDKKLSHKEYKMQKLYDRKCTTNPTSEKCKILLSKKDLVSGQRKDVDFLKKNPNADPAKISALKGLEFR